MRIGLLFLVFWITVSQRYAPFIDKNYYPPYFLKVTAIVSSMKAFTLPYITPFINIPNCYPAVTLLEWSNEIHFEVNILMVNQSHLSSYINYSSTVASVKVSYLVTDPAYYPSTLSTFNFSQTDQNISIIGFSDHQLGFLTALAITPSDYPFGQTPIVTSLLSPSSTASLKYTQMFIAYNVSQIIINMFTIIYVDFNLSAFQSVPGVAVGERFLLWSSNGIATEMINVKGKINRFGRAYFVGLLFPFDISFLHPPYTVDIQNQLAYNADYYVSQVLLYVNRCPSLFPITDLNRTNCSSSCQKGYYANSQMLCSLCHPNCLECSLSPANCTNCMPPFVLKYMNICGCSNTTLYLGDTSGDTLGNGSCPDCSLYMPGCGSCTTTTKCTACIDSLSFDANGNCVCPYGTTTVTVLGILRCVVPVQGSQSCQNGFIQEGLSCSCSMMMNMSLVDGVCL